MKVQRAYLKFRRQYRHMLIGAKREMDTPIRKALIDTIAATAFSAGFRAPRNEPDKPIKLKSWRGRNTTELK